MTATVLQNPQHPPSQAAIQKAVAEFAQKAIGEIFEKSTISDSSKTFPRFTEEEVKLGKVLGKGGFGTVYEVLGFDPEKKTARRGSICSLKLNRVSNSEFGNDPEVGVGQMESRKFISDHCVREGGDSRYAVKILSKEVVQNPSTFAQGTIDMAIETRFLSDIEHTNIIKMRACASISPYKAGYFIVMDRLYDTMEKRIEKWAKRQKKASSIKGKLFDRNGEKLKDLLEEKLVAAFDLSAAILYLHNRNIVYRDLKPDNIGFDIRDDVKLFDFGLAKEVFPEDRDADGFYKLTGMTGTMRFMAPEVALEKPYNASCDVYSFAIMFWQMYTGKTPFAGYFSRSFESKVWVSDFERPTVEDSWPVPIKTLLEHGWSQNPHDRPTFDYIYNTLRHECIGLREGNATGLNHSRHQRRRSTFVFRRGTNDVAKA